MGIPEAQVREIVSKSLKDLPKAEDICPICDNSRWVYPVTNGKPDYSHAIRCRCARQGDFDHRQQMYLRLCELPPETENLTFENYNVLPDLKEAYDAAQDLAAHRLNWLTLMSEVDRGKTHLAIAICREWLKQGKSAKYALVTLLLDELKNGFQGEGASSYQARFDFYCKVNLLVLDDLGMGRPTDWAVEKLETLIDYRYINKLPLVVTTNKNLDYLSVRIGSRLKRADSSRIVVIKAEEYRLRKKAAKK
jgi:DNA replication protein DnaC